MAFRTLAHNRFEVCDYGRCRNRTTGAGVVGNKIFCNKHFKEIYGMAKTDPNEEERTRRMTNAFYMNYNTDGNLHRLFVYPAYADGSWKNVDVFFDHFNMSWRYRCSGQIVGVDVEKRIVSEIKRREFEQFMDGQAPLPEPSCATCGAPPADYEGV